MTQKLTLGRFPAHGLADARQWACELTRQRDGGVDPRAAQQAALAQIKAEALRERMTVKRAFDIYMEREGSTRRTAVAKRRMQALNVTPVIGDRALADVDHDDLAKIVSDKFKTAPVASNRLKTHIAKFFKWCVKKGREETGLKVNPALDLIPLHDEVKRDRWFDDYENGLFLKALDCLDPRFALPFRLLMLTGTRLNEVMRAEWSEFDLAKGEWLIPGARTKNKRAHLVPLAPAALALINANPKSNASRLCFPSLRNPDTPASGISKAVTRLRIRMDELAAIDGRTVKPWRLHDLRHGFSTGLNGLGVAPNVVEALLNHVSGGMAGVAGRYNHHAYRAEKGQALKLWERHLKKCEVK